MAIIKCKVSVTVCKNNAFFVIDFELQFVGVIDPALSALLDHCISDKLAHTQHPFECVTQIDSNAIRFL